MIDKIVKRLEEQFNQYGNGEHYKGFEKATQQAIDIVKQVAEEHKCGWTSVSEKPSESDDYLVYYHKKYDSTNFETNWHGICSFIDSDRGWQTEEGETILAWQPLPQPYKEG